MSFSASPNATTSSAAIPRSLRAMASAAPLSAPVAVSVSRRLPALLIDSTNRTS